MKYRYLMIIAGMLLSLVLLGLGLSKVYAGGWAVISLESLPQGAQPGQPFTVRFTVLQHGVSPMADLDPTIQAEHTTSGTRLSFDAHPTNESGLYEASLTLPEAGEWDWSIAAFTMVQPMPALLVETAPAIQPESKGQITLLSAGNYKIALPTASLLAGVIATALLAAALWLRRTSTARLAPIMMVFSMMLIVFAVVGATRTYATEPQPADREQIVPSVAIGDALFTSKGCVSCHTHNLVSLPAGFPVNSGPNLTRVNLGADYLRLWLKNPQAVKPLTDMPNLHLSEDEIEALVAFLIRE